MIIRVIILNSESSINPFMTSPLNVLLYDYLTNKIRRDFLSGYGQERGGLVTKLHNNYWKPLDVILLENIPWYIPVYIHTIKIKCQGKLLTPCK